MLNLDPLWNSMLTHFKLHLDFALSILNSLGPPFDSIRTPFWAPFWILFRYLFAHPCFLQKAHRTYTRALIWSSEGVTIYHFGGLFPNPVLVPFLKPKMSPKWEPKGFQNESFVKPNYVKKYQTVVHFKRSRFCSRFWPPFGPSWVPKAPFWDPWVTKAPFWDDQSVILGRYIR